MHDSHHPTTHWHTLGDGRVQCDICPRACKLREGQRGMCFVRARHQDQVVLTTYGRSSGFCIDPIEKKPLHHFLPGTPVLSFGTAGCNLACKFCQNWDISKSRDMDRLMSTASPEAIAKAAAGNGCKSVAFTYNDPVIFHEYAIDTAQACRELGVRTVAVSAGYVCAAPREEFYAQIDAVNIDLKGFTESFYKRLAAATLADVLETIAYIHQETDVWMELTNLIIPEENDSEAELHEMCAWISENLGPEVPIHFSAFHPDYKMMHRPRTPVATLRRAREIAIEHGLHYAYTGNVHDREGDATLCPGCRRVVIARDWFELNAWHLDAEGRCASCGTAVAGVFDAQPGEWGRRRQAVRIGG